jgi:DNA-binding NtrC family response regulator
MGNSPREGRTMPPRKLHVVNERFRAGYLEESLKELRRVYDPKIPADRVLMAELLIETEGQEQIRSLIGQYADLATIESSVRARAYLTLATALRRENRLSEAIRLHERAVRVASGSGDVAVMCRAQLLLMSAKFELFGPSSLGTLAAETWQSAMSSGDSLLLALVHCHFAGFEGRRGAFDLARRHLDLGREHLKHEGNPYLEGLICNNSSTLSAVMADPHTALGYAGQALELTAQSGDRFTRISAVNNLCHVSIMLGRIGDAERHLVTGESLIRNEPFLRMCLYESKAHIQLLSGRLDQCESTLSDLIALYEEAAVIERSYAALEIVPTHVRLLRKLGRFDAALDMARIASIAARERRLPLLEVIFNIHCADALIDLRQIDRATQTIGQVAKTIGLLGSDSLTIRAELERVRGRVLVICGEQNAARERFALSIRMHDATGQTEARDEAARCRDEAMGRVGSGPADDSEPPVPTRREYVGPPPLGVSEIEAAASVLTTAGRPDLLGMIAYELLAHADVAIRTALLACDASSVEVIGETNWPTAEVDTNSESTTVIDLGTHKNRTYQLLIEPALDVSKTSRLAAFETIIRTAVEKEEARQDQLQRTSVWPKALDVEGDGPLLGSQRMREVYREAIKVADSELTILLTGETGVGKEILAREIHRLSPRSGHDFRPVVCAGIPSGVLESQLFGYRKGSFTGAVSDFPGVIRGAQGGTLFLDEIGELTQDLQVKLLRFLDSKEVHGLGELAPIEVDLRIIAATNANLSQLVEERKFREDLLYRLSVATFNIPPLRERREEIPVLIEHFLAKYSQQNRKPVPKVTDEALEHLLVYRWPGNIRQLRNEMERLAGITDPGSSIRPRDLNPEILSRRRSQPTIAGPNEIVIRLDQQLAHAIDQLEREMIRRTLNGYKGNLDGAARALGITRKGLYHKRQRLGLL